jgi:circadian clock protein KaiB
MKTKGKSSRKPKTNAPAKRTRSRAAKKPVKRYALRLYITGQTPRSRQSVQNLRALCDKHIPGQFDLEVIDIYQQPAMAAAVQIIAAPTLIKSMPLPLRRLVGDFSDQDRVILGLDIKLSGERGSA